MKILGRPLRRYTANLLRLHLHLRDLGRAVALFTDPWSVITCYVRRTRPVSGVISLRSGLQIHLSEDPLDVVTVVGIFVRRDYGAVHAGSEVVDIGANIGVFALYAIHCGASRVHAYEPSADAFACLERNVRANNLQSRIEAFKVAVGAGPERTIPFPRRSSVFNSLDGAGGRDCDDVPLETLATVLRRLERPELIKLDCEGEEERILAEASLDTLRRVQDIRLEYHHGRGAAIAADVARRGFVVEHRWDADARGGLLWLRRSGSVPSSAQS